MFWTSLTVAPSIFGEKPEILFCVAALGAPRRLDATTQSKVEFKKISERSIIIGMVAYLSSLGPVDHSPAEPVSGQRGSKDLLRSFWKELHNIFCHFRVLTCEMTSSPKPKPGCKCR